MTTSRRALPGAGLACAALPWDIALTQAPAGAGGTLRIGMMAAAVPLPTGQTDGDGEDRRFMAHTVFDTVTTA